MAPTCSLQTVLELQTPSRYSMSVKLESCGKRWEVKELELKMGLYRLQLWFSLGGGSSFCICRTQVESLRRLRGGFFSRPIDLYSPAKLSLNSSEGTWDLFKVAVGLCTIVLHKCLLGRQHITLEMVVRLGSTQKVAVLDWDHVTELALIRWGNGLIWGFLSVSFPAARIPKARSQLLPSKQCTWKLSKPQRKLSQWGCTSRFPIFLGLFKF